MTLHEKQILFPQRLARLLLFIPVIGLGVKGGEWWRPDWVAAEYAKEHKGIKLSNHILRIGTDLLLFNGKTWLQDIEDYRPVATFWKGLSTDDCICCWGGDFRDAKGNPAPDIFHFSFFNQGIK